MEEGLELDGDGAVVGVGGHERCHRGPPALAGVGLSDRVPAGLVFDFDVGEELAGFAVEEDGVVVGTVAFEFGFEVGPDGVVTSLVFVVFVRIDRHDKGFTYH